MAAMFSIASPSKSRSAFRDLDEELTTPPPKSRSGFSDASSTKSRPVQTTLTGCWVAGNKQSVQKEHMRSPVTKKDRAVRGTALTFKGRRPPKDPSKLEAYLKEYNEHHEARLQKQKEKDQNRKPKRKSSEVQAAFREHMRLEMASGAGKPSHRMTAAAGSWAAKVHRTAKGAADEVLQHT